MRAEKVVASLLEGAGAVTAIVGTKVYAVMGAQVDDAPFVVYWKESADRERAIAMNGPSLVRALISVQTVARTYQQLKDLGEAVRVALCAKFGDIAGVQVNEIQVAGEGPDLFDPEREVFAQLWQFLVIHQE
jgi:hypothetical protein